MPSGLRGEQRGTSVRDYLSVLKRRKWLLLQAVVLVPLAAVLLSLWQEERYRASAEVLLSRQNLAASLTGTPDFLASQDASRLAETQARLARVPAVAERALAAQGLAGRPVQAFLDASEVHPRQDADLLEFRVTDRDAGLAARLATEYARQFTIYRRELDTAAIARARDDVGARLTQLEAAGDADSPLYLTLLEKKEQLGTLEALQTSNAFLVRPADEAEKVQPRPVRDGIVGLALGLVLGIGLAFLREALDTRVRSAEEVGEHLGLPLLARLPEPPRQLRRNGRLAMLHDPAGVSAEAFRMLRTNLEFVNLERGARTIMITSAVEEEGKSTTAANLAVALARAGRRIALVDLDLRRPYLDRFFDLGEAPGLTDIALGDATLDEALVQVDLGWGSEAVARASGDGRPGAEGALRVLGLGPVPPNPGEFMATGALEHILAELRQRFDLTVVDAAPLLHVGDGLALSGKVDGLILVLRLNVIRRPMVRELERVLETCPAGKLGFVLTGAELDEAYGYGYGYGAYYRRVYGQSEKERVA